MPFDGPDKASKGDMKMTTEQQKAKDRGYQLVYALRHIGNFQDFDWDFTIFRRENCHTAGCACGLAIEMWPEERMNLRDIWEVGEFIGLDEITAGNVFGFTGAGTRLWRYDLSTPTNEVTPEMVADELEKALDNAV